MATVTSGSYDVNATFSSPTLGTGGLTADESSISVAALNGSVTGGGREL